MEGMQKNDTGKEENEGHIQWHNDKWKTECRKVWGVFNPLSK